MSNDCPPSRRPFQRRLSGHRIVYTPGGETLVVSFDNAGRPFEGPFDSREAWGEKFYLREGHSLLGMIARTPDWFRCSEFIAEFERIAATGFFRQFKNVVLTGGSMGAFAACAFSRLVPGCTVLAVSPQICVDPAVVPWEKRFPRAVQQNWQLPYGNAGQGLEFAKRVYLVYDPLDRRDSAHIRSFPVGDNIVPLKIPAGGHDVSILLHQLNVLKPYTRAVIDGSMTAEMFRSLIARRKDGMRYRRILARHAIHRGHYKAAARVAELSQAKFPGGEFPAIRVAALTAAGELPQAMKLLYPADADNNLMGRYKSIEHAYKPALPVKTAPPEKKALPMNAPLAHRFDRAFPNLKRNIFIVTYGRSGSTLLQNLLMTIPGCDLRGENHNVIESIWHAAARARLAKNTWGKNQQPASHPWYGADQVKPMIFARGMIDSFVNNVMCPAPDSRYFGFKEIRYNVFGDRLSEVLDFMRFHFKDAFFVFNTRNVDSVAQSAWWKDWNRDDVVSLVQNMDRRFAEYHAAHPDYTALLSYEDFSSNTLALRPFFAKLGEPFDEERIKAVLSNRLGH